MRLSLKRFWNNRRGHDLVEYALMVGFLALAAGAVMPGFVSSLKAIFGQGIAQFRTPGSRGSSRH
jgi:Flp pilus assembly pilin Flp